MKKRGKRRGTTVAAIPGPAHPLRPHAEGVVGLRVREEPSAFLYGEIAAIARVLAGCERRLRAAIGDDAVKGEHDGVQG